MVRSRRSRDLCGTTFECRDPGISIALDSFLVDSQSHIRRLRCSPYLQPRRMRTPELFAKWLVNLGVQPFVYDLFSRWSVDMWLVPRSRNRVVIFKDAG